MLSPLQERVAEIVAGLDEAEGFALAGGAALIARGDVQRQTRDLDFFGLSGDAVDRLAPAVRRALTAAGLVVGHVQVNPGFVRLIVSDGDERTELDLASDARLFPAEPGRLAPTLTGEELAVLRDISFTVGDGEAVAIFGHVANTALQQRGLAGAVMAEDRHRLAFVHRERNIPETDSPP